MLEHFFKGFFSTALCMSIALAFKVPLHYWREVSAHEWGIGLALIAAASIVGGMITALCWLTGRRDRFGRRKDIDSTDIMPFI